MDRLSMYLLVQRGCQSFFAFPYKLHVVLVILFSGQIYRAKNSTGTISSLRCVILHGITEDIIITHLLVTCRSMMLTRYNWQYVWTFSNLSWTLLLACYTNSWRLKFQCYRIRAGASRPCNETYRKNRKTDMRDSDICIFRLRLAVIWNIENITDMLNVEGKWSVESL